MNPGVAQEEITSADTLHSQQPWLSGKQVSLVEVLDRVLNKGAVLTGGITISVADIPLLYVGLNLLIASIETLEGQRTKPLGTGEKVYAA